MKDIYLRCNTVMACIVPWANRCSPSTVELLFNLILVSLSGIRPNVDALDLHFIVHYDFDIRFPRVEEHCRWIEHLWCDGDDLRGTGHSPDFDRNGLPRLAGKRTDRVKRFSI